MKQSKSEVEKNLIAKTKKLSVGMRTILCPATTESGSCSSEIEIEIRNYEYFRIC